MILSLLAAVAGAPLFWLLVPAGLRKNVLAGISLIALGLYDVRLPFVVLIVVAHIFATARAIARAERGSVTWVCFAGLMPLALLFSLNKSGSIVTLIGTSYLVLKAATILIEVSRRNLPAPSFASLARWLLHFPIFPSGPIEAFQHFDDQEPRIDSTSVLHGLERILFGCVKALLLAHYLSSWATPIVNDPSPVTSPLLLVAMYATTLKVYFDFSGYSDIAIGLSALYGYEIQENFDRPLLQRNIVALWQRWHMTLTGWLRIYIFTPYTRAMMKRGRAWHRPAILSAQIVTMVACGIWHGLTSAFLLWGFLHGLALVWAGTLAREYGRKLPGAVVQWWRDNPIGYATSTALTLTAFSAINILVVADIPATARFFAALLHL